MKKILSYLYPFFFALYPILELRNYNITYVDSASLVRPMLLSILITAALWVILKLFTGEWQRSGIFTTLIFISFFSYGHAFIQIESVAGTMIRHRYLILIFGGLLSLAGMFSLRWLKTAQPFINFLAVAGGILIVFSTARSLQHDLSVYQSSLASREMQEAVLQEVTESDVNLKPDIYLILLDAHTSEYALRKEFGFDNSAFTQQLKDLGFYVAQCAQSNYPVTNLSLTSAFYANYHETPTLFPVYSSLVIETLRSQGYQVITFENRSKGHFALAEDLRLARNQMFLGKVDLTGGLSEFEIMLIRTSFLRIAFDIPQLIPWFNVESIQQVEYYEHFQQTYFILEELKRLPEMDGPKFVFAHVLVPHSPFIFSPTGEFLWADDPAAGYISNVQFIDSQIVPVVAEIIEKSRIPPILIIMGDHGATGVPQRETPEMRMSILNAYYVNEGAKQDLYETITPVNSFRIIFNNYFGTSYPLLEDLSYHTGDMNNFTAETLVANECPGSP